MKISGLITTSPFPISLFVITILLLSSFVQQKIYSACKFLTRLYNPTLQLVKTTPSSNLYYISSDNMLAKKAVAYCDGEIGQNITQ